MVLTGCLAHGPRAVGGTARQGFALLKGHEMIQIADIPITKRGAGGRTCCATHRDRCLIGHIHVWCTWFKDGQLQRTADTYHCHSCGGVCTADEGA